MVNIKVIKNIWLFCIHFLKITVLFTLISLVSNWVEMCERKRALIWNYFSKDGSTTIPIEELIDGALKKFLMSVFLLRRYKI